MKKAATFVSLRLAAVTTSLLLVPSVWASNILLNIDITNPSAVVFSSTGFNATLNDSTSNQNSGVSLLGIFTSNYSILTPAPATSSLTPAGPTDPYNLVVNGLSPTVPQTALNFFRTITLQQTFTTSAPAFAGSLSYNFTGASFASLGSTGNIIAGDGVSGSGATIGQWQVIPEPSAASLLLFGGVGALLVSRRRKS